MIFNVFNPNTFRYQKKIHEEKKVIDVMNLQLNNEIRLKKHGYGNFGFVILMCCCIKPVD